MGFKCSVQDLRLRAVVVNFNSEIFKDMFDPLCASFFDGCELRRYILKRKSHLRMTK